MIRVILLCMLIAALEGCAALNEPGERAWLAAHAVDVAQTRTFRNDPCIEEVDPFTRSLIGREPSTGATIAWGVGMAAFHVGVTELLLRTDHPRVAKVWEWVSFTEKGITVARNHRLGARISGNNSMGCMR